jgi:hypothetical protein
MLTDDVFISFDYSSSSRSFVITLADGGVLAAFRRSVVGSGGLVFPSCTGLPSFQANPDVFDTAAMPDTAADDIGSSVRFVLASDAIPEPPTWSVMLLGFAGFGYPGYRRVKQAAVADV